MTSVEKLRQLRDAAGLTQAQMAERSGINLWTIRGYEQGRREPNLKGELSRAKALKVAAEVFSECDETTTEEQSARPRGKAWHDAIPASPAGGKNAAPFVRERGREW